LRETIVRSTDRAKEAAEALSDYVFRNGKWEQVSYTLDQYVGAVREEFKLGPIELMGD